MGRLGARTVVLTNAAGGLNPAFGAGHPDGDPRPPQPDRPDPPPRPERRRDRAALPGPDRRLRAGPCGPGCMAAARAERTWPRGGHLRRPARARATRPRPRSRMLRGLGRRRRRDVDRARGDRLPLGRDSRCAGVSLVTNPGAGYSGEPLTPRGGPGGRRERRSAPGPGDPALRRATWPDPPAGGSARPRPDTRRAAHRLEVALAARDGSGLTAGVAPAWPTLVADDFIEFGWRAGGPGRQRRSAASWQHRAVERPAIEDFAMMSWLRACVLVDLSDRGAASPNRASIWVRRGAAPGRFASTSGDARAPGPAAQPPDYADRQLATGGPGRLAFSAQAARTLSLWGRIGQCPSRLPISSQ